MSEPIVIILNGDYVKTVVGAESFVSVDLSEIRDDQMCPVCGDHIREDLLDCKPFWWCPTCEFDWTHATNEQIAELARRDEQ